MTTDKPIRVTLTKAQIETDAGLELAQMCQSILVDGQLTDTEIKDFNVWIAAHKDTDLPSIRFLSELLTRVLADGKIEPEERQELTSGIERVVPKEQRDALKKIRKQREQEDRERDRPIASFDFMVAGAKRREYSEANSGVSEGDRISLDREPYNRADKNAVEVYCSGDKLGYVPRGDAKEMAPLLDAGGKYTAEVKKVLGYEAVIPVVVAKFYKSDAVIPGSTETRLTDKASPESKNYGCFVGGLKILFGLFVFAVLLEMLGR